MAYASDWSLPLYSSDTAKQRAHMGQGPVLMRQEQDSLTTQARKRGTGDGRMATKRGRKNRTRGF